MHQSEEQKLFLLENGLKPGIPHLPEDFRNKCEAYFYTFRIHILHSRADFTVLHLAVQLGDYNAVQYLFDSCRNGESEISEVISQPNMRNLVKTCVQNTSNLSEDNLNGRILTLEILVGVDDTLLQVVEGLRNQYESPLLDNNVHLEMMKSLIKLGADPLKTNYREETFIHQLCANGIEPNELHNLILFLIDQIPEKTQKLFKVSSKIVRQSLVYYAMKFIKIETLELLLTVEDITFSGIDRRDGCSLLEIAIVHGRNMDIIQFLIEHGANIHGSTREGNLIQTAALHQHFEALKFLISEGLNANGEPSRTSPLSLVFDGNSANSFEIAKYLLEHGASLTALDRDDNSVLYNLIDYVNWSDLVKIIEFYIRHEISLNEEERTRQNWLLYAAERVPSEELHKLVELLVKTGNGDLFTQTMNTGFDFLIASFSKREDVSVETLELLRSLKVNFHKRDKKGRSLLLIAISNGKCESILEFLVDVGVDPNIPDSDGNGVFHHAVKAISRNINVIRSISFLSKTCVNNINHAGDSALHVAARQYPSIISDLLSLGADGLLKNNEGHLPFDILQSKLNEWSDVSNQLELLRRAKLDGESIFLSIQRRNIDELKLACDFCTGKGVKVIEFWREFDGIHYSPVHLAIRVGFVEGVKYLLEDQECRNRVFSDTGFSTLFHACVSMMKVCLEEDECLVKIIKLLIKMKPDMLDGTDWENFRSSIVFDAIEGGRSTTFVEMLFEIFYKDCQIVNLKMETALHYAAKSTSVTLLEYFIRKGLKVNAKDDQGRTPLHWAANSSWPSLTICDILLKSGASVQEKDDQGCTPLHVVITGRGVASEMLSNQKLRIAHLLMENGGDVGLVDERKMNVIHYASRLSAKTFHAFCETIVNSDAGRYLIMVDDKGRIPLHSAFTNLPVEPLVKTLKLFKSKCFDYNMIEINSRNSLLHLVTKTLPKSHDLVSFLLENGADCKLRNKVGQTCLHFIVVNGSMETLTLLLKNGALINAKDSRGDTPLHYLGRCELENEEDEVYIRKLVTLRDYGADFSAINKRGQRPMDLMRRLCSEELMRAKCPMKLIRRGQMDEKHDGVVEEALDDNRNHNNEGEELEDDDESNDFVSGDDDDDESNDFVSGDDDEN